MFFLLDFEKHSFFDSNKRKSPVAWCRKNDSWSVFSTIEISTKMIFNAVDSSHLKKKKKKEFGISKSDLKKRKQTAFGASLLLTQTCLMIAHLGLETQLFFVSQK